MTRTFTSILNSAERRLLRHFCSSFLWLGEWLTNLSLDISTAIWRHFHSVLLFTHFLDHSQSFQITWLYNVVWLHRLELLMGANAKHNCYGGLKRGFRLFLVGIPNRPELSHRDFIVLCTYIHSLIIISSRYPVSRLTADSESSKCRGRFLEPTYSQLWNWGLGALEVLSRCSAVSQAIPKPKKFTDQWAAETWSLSLPFVFPLLVFTIHISFGDLNWCT